MVFGDLRCSAVLACRSRSGRPRPVSFLGIVAFLSCLGCLRPSFSHPSDGGAGGGRGAGGDDGEDAEAQPVQTKADNNQVGAKQTHSIDNKHDDNQQLKLELTAIKRFLASIDKNMETIKNHIIAWKENSRDNSQGPSAAPAVTENKDTVNRTKGLLGSMFSIADKLPMFCGGVFILLSNLSAANSPTPNSSAPKSPTPNSPAPKEGQNFGDSWMQVIKAGSLILCFISFIVIALASKFKDSESIGSVKFGFYMWLMLLVFIALWLGLCVILHFLAHTSKFIVWPLGIIFLIVSVVFWYLEFYKERKQILEELKKNRELQNAMSPVNLGDALAPQGLERANSYAMNISGPSSILPYAQSPNQRVARGNWGANS